jgi:hypothetical protein
MSHHLPFSNKMGAPSGPSRVQSMLPPVLGC